MKRKCTASVQTFDDEISKTQVLIEQQKSQSASDIAKTGGTKEYPGPA